MVRLIEFSFLWFGDFAVRGREEEQEKWTSYGSFHFLCLEECRGAGK